MRAPSTTLLLATLAPCIHAGVIAARKDHGTFNTYTDDHCGHFEQTIYAWEGVERGQICPNVKSVKADIANDTLVIWINGGTTSPLVVRPGDTACHKVDGQVKGPFWNLSD